MQPSQSLGTKAADIACKAAIAWLEKHKALTLANVDALEVHLKRTCKAALPVALADAKEALDCGMTDAAQATFAATMRIAGIEAARCVHFVAE